jgi:thiol-disulfide isomerase/thioredoxin
MKGKELQGFNFTDLDGKVYDKVTTAGKIVVLKCWFIGCVPCIEKMPALKELVNQYKNQRDIVFVSLAFDKKEDLKKFLAKKTFDYAVVANQKDYLIKDLEVTSFPTHILINKKGKVVKVAGSYEEMETALKKVVSR